MIKIKKLITYTSLLCVIMLLCTFFVIYISQKNINNLKAEASDMILTNDNVTVKIYDYNDTDGWDFLDTKKVEITVDFDDTEATNKKVKISLAEGMSYRSYPVLEVTDSFMQTKIIEEDNLYSAVSNVTIPEIYSNTLTYDDYKKSSYGDLTYDIYDNISSVTIFLNVKVDSIRYYGEKIIEDAIVVNATKNENDSVGIVNKNINTNNSKSAFDMVSRKNDICFTTSVFASTSDKTNYGGTRFMHSAYIYNGRYVVPYFKKRVYTIYYPEDSTFVKAFGGYNEKEITNFSSVVDHPDDHYVTITIDDYSNISNDNFYFGVHVRYAAPNIDELEGKLSTRINTPNKSTVEDIYYDGTVKEYQAVSYDYVTYLSPSTFVNKLNITKNDSSDDNDDATFTWGPFFVLKNDTPGIKTNQVIEYKIDPNYQAVRVTFPRDLSASTIKNIQFKTTNDDSWKNYDKKLTGLFLTKEMLGEEYKDEYITAARATISSYKENYKFGFSSPNTFDGMNVIGNLKSDTSTANVTLYTYDEAEKSLVESSNYGATTIETMPKTLTTTTATISYTEEKTTASNRLHTFFTFDKQTAYTGETIKINGYFDIYRYKYGTILFIKDTEVYVRQPKGFYINPNTIVLKDNEKENVNYTISSHTNSYGETIYVLKTNYTVGHGLTEKLYSNILRISFDLKINSDCNVPLVSNDDLLSWGGQNVRAVGAEVKIDKYDFDGDENITEYVMAVGNKTIAIQPSKSFVITSKIKKGEEESTPYDATNPLTIMDLYDKEDATYEINIINNSSEDLDSYKLYIPIPKKGMNFGEKFQEDAFSWDMSLDRNITIPDGYRAEYSTTTGSVDGITNINDMSFTATVPADLDRVTMVKIVALETIEIGTNEKISINIKPSEINSLNNKTVNIWNPVYTVFSPSISGEFKSSSIAVKLNFTKISGKIYVDVNNNQEYDVGDKTGLDVTAELYKLIGTTYQKVEGAVINVNPETGDYFIDDSTYLNRGTYGIKFSIPEGYEISNLEEVRMDGMITDLSVEEENISNLDIGYLKYELNFKVENKIITIDEEETITIKEIEPNYFENIKNNTLTYKWKVLDEYKEKVSINDTNSNETTITGLEEAESAIIEVTIYDKYGNSKTKTFKVKVTNEVEPVVNAIGTEITIGDQIEYEKYIKESYDYKGNKIILVYSGDGKNVSYESKVPESNGKATKAGEYEITYEVEDKYGNIGSITIKITVKEKTVIEEITDKIEEVIPPKTLDNIYIAYMLLQISILMILMIIGKVRYKKNYVN